MYRLINFVLVLKIISYHLKVSGRGNVLRYGIDLGSRSRAAVAFSAALSTTFIIFPTCHKSRTPCLKSRPPCQRSRPPCKKLRSRLCLELHHIRQICHARLSCPSVRHIRYVCPSHPLRLSRPSRLSHPSVCVKSFLLLLLDAKHPNIHQQRSSLHYSISDLPEIETTLPEIETEMPEIETALPEIEAAMLQIETALLEIETALPEIGSVLPEIDFVRG